MGWVFLVPCPFRGYLWYQVPLRGWWVSLVPGPFWGLGIQEWGGYPGEGWVLIPQGWICGYVQEVGNHPSPLWTHGILWDMVNKWTVCILLECFLVINCITDCTQTRTVEIRKWFPCCIFFCKVLASLFIKQSRAYFSEEIVIFRVSARIPLWPNFLYFHVVLGKLLPTLQLLEWHPPPSGK